MITPLDIQNKEFNVGFRGYKMEEVESFLDDLIVDYEKLYKENIELKDKIARVTENLNHYDNIEDTLKNTLVVAQKTAEEVNLNAKQKAEQIIKEAEESSRKIIEKSNTEVINIQRQYEEIKKEINIFKMRFETLLKSQIETFENYYNELNNDNE